MSFAFLIFCGFLSWMAFDLIAFICKSKLWKLRDDFVDEYLLPQWSALDHAPDERLHVLRLIGELERNATHKPVRSYIAFKFKKLTCYNEAYRIANEVIDKTESRGL